jgi:hypothetical protein
MANPNRALVLHLVGGGEPVVYALSEEGASDLAPKLTQLLSEGRVYAPALADGTTVAMNFGHVVTVHLDELPSHARVYGNGQPRRHGFAT